MQFVWSPTADTAMREEGWKVSEILSSFPQPPDPMETRMKISTPGTLVVDVDLVSFSIVLEVGSLVVLAEKKIIGNGLVHVLSYDRADPPKIVIGSESYTETRSVTGGTEAGWHTRSYSVMKFSGAGIYAGNKAGIHIECSTLYVIGGAIACASEVVLKARKEVRINGGLIYSPEAITIDAPKVDSPVPLVVRIPIPNSGGYSGIYEEVVDRHGSAIIACSIPELVGKRPLRPDYDASVIRRSTLTILAEHCDLGACSIVTPSPHGMVALPPSARFGSAEMWRGNDQMGRHRNYVPEAHYRIAGGIKLVEPAQVAGFKAWSRMEYHDGMPGDNVAEFIVSHVPVLNPIEVSPQ